MIRTNRGFTIVELLIVIVVIGILAAITIVAYNGIQARASNAKISSDLTLLNKAIIAARINGDRSLYSMTANGWTAGTCISKPTGTNLATLPRTDACWLDYASALNHISNFSGINVRNMVDPLGRPYAIDENEWQNGNQSDCTRDDIGSFSNPFVINSYVFSNIRSVPNWASNCL